jgi:hypothetical protein
MRVPQLTVLSYARGDWRGEPAFWKLIVSVQTQPISLEEKNLWARREDLRPLRRSMTVAAKPSDSGMDLDHDWVAVGTSTSSLAHQNAISAAGICNQIGVSFPRRLPHGVTLHCCPIREQRVETAHRFSIALAVRAACI